MLTQVITPPHVKNLTLCLLSNTAGVQQEIETLEHVGVIKKSISHWASPVVVVPKKSAPGEPPRCRMCVDFRGINELQPKIQRVDQQTNTQGNSFLIPLPKINEMYANLHGAKISTTLDLHSGYYHIALDNESKAKTAFVTPFGKYEFNAVPFGLAQAPAYFQQLISIIMQDCSNLRWPIWMTSSSSAKMSKNISNTLRSSSRNSERLDLSSRNPNAIHLKRKSII